MVFYLNKETYRASKCSGAWSICKSASINVVPDEVSKKSLKTLDGRLVIAVAVRGVSGEHQLRVWEAA